MFIISFILHSDTRYPTNRFGYVGEYFSSQNIIELQKILNVSKEELHNVMLSAKKHQSGYFIINTVTKVCPIIDTLECRGLFTKNLIAVPFKSLPKKIRELDSQYIDEKVVNVYFSPNKRWKDYLMSISHLKDTG